MKKGKVKFKLRLFYCVSYKPSKRMIDHRKIISQDAIIEAYSWVDAFAVFKGRGVFGTRFILGRAIEYIGEQGLFVREIGDSIND